MTMITTLMQPIAATLRFANRVTRGLGSRWRSMYYRALGVKISGSCWLRRLDIPRNWRSVTLHGPVALDLGVVLLVSGDETPDKLVLRSGTYVNRYTMFDAHRRIEVGRDCMIGPFCYVTDANHGTALERPFSMQPMNTAEVVLEDNVWLGAGVTVLAGVHIGRGTVVGAGSVVTTDLPADVVAVGVPARVLRCRRLCESSEVLHKSPDRLCGEDLLSDR